MNKFYSAFLSVLMALSITGCGQDTSDKAAENVITVEAWGPKSIALDKKTNKQKDGTVSIWFKLNVVVPSNELEAWAGGLKMSKIKTAELKGSFAIERSLLKTPGSLPIYLVHVPSGKQIALGDFVVLPSAGAAPNIRITAWGPQSTLAGKGFNVQKNGVSAIWFKMSGAATPSMMEAWFGNKKMEKFSVSPNKGGAMQVPQELIANKGEFPVYLVHKPSKKRYDIGKFIVK